MNGAVNNIHSFASNQTIATPSIDLPTESQPEDSSLSIENPNSSQLPDTNTTTSDVHPQSPEAQHTSLFASDKLGAEPAPTVETVINSALEDTIATSAVPPVVEAQESDLRDTTSHLALAAEAQLKSQKPADFKPEPDIPIRNMDGTPEAQNVTFNNDMTDFSALPSSDAPPSPPLQDEESTTVSQDAEMTDAPESASFTKVPREREDDNYDEPSAKRTKTEDDTAMADVSAHEFQSPAAPATAQNDEAVKSETSISTYECREIIKILKNVVRTKDGKNFKQSVRLLWPGFADSYYTKISHPVDLATMETNLRENKYPSMDDFKAEVNLIYDNALLFNGDNHTITTSGQVVRDAILNKMANVPPEPVAAPKAPKKQARKSTPLAETAPRTAARRPSRSGGTAPIAVVAPAPTFALDPTTNTPLIRRDSTKGDGGRPKREIHPPKNKDLPYTTTRPKNKKVATELKFCEEVLTELKKPKHHPYSNAFLVPVDPISMNIPNYFQVIKHPMDISTADKKLKNGEYQSAKAFEADMKLMFVNCYKFNPPTNAVHMWGRQFETVFNEAWANKNKWLADHAPAAQTPSSNGGSDDEESEEEEEVEEPTTGPNSIAALSERLNEEQEKMINLMGNPKKDAQMIEMQKDMIELIKNKIAAAKATPPTKKVVKKAKAPKPAKKQAPARKAGPAATKKSAPARQKYMGTHEKNIISIGIQRLPEDVIKEILAMIKGETDVDVSIYQCSTWTKLTTFQEGDDGEVELDIDVVSPASLWKIYHHVMKHAPEVEAEARAMMEEKEEEAPRATLAKPPPKKKNKPMSKSEQERKIEQLEQINKTFERHASGSQEPMPSEHPYLMLHQYTKHT